MNSLKALPKPQSGIDFNELLKSTETKGTGTKKKEIPVLQVPDDVKEAVDTYLEAKEIKKSAEATLDLSGATVTGYVKAVQDQEGFKGHFRNSFKVPGHKKTLTWVSSNRWTINPEDLDNLKSLLGDDAAHLLSVKWVLKVKDAVLEDEALRNRLVGLLGNQFSEFFESKASISVSEDFDQALYAATDPEGLRDLRTFARQYSPSLR